MQSHQLTLTLPFGAPTEGSLLYAFLIVVFAILLTLIFLWKMTSNTWQKQSKAYKAALEIQAQGKSEGEQYSGPIYLMPKGLRSGLMTIWTFTLLAVGYVGFVLHL